MAVRVDQHKSLRSAPGEAGIYSPLGQPRSIRLVDIESGRGSSTIYCRLVEANLDQPVNSYLALSYAWGDPSNIGSITCDGKPLSVTKSLVNAMEQLRERYPGRLFWIDAICINQQDPVERAAQVQLMRHIYRSAENVIIYLGEDCPGLDRAMDLFHQLHDKAKVWADMTDDERNDLKSSVGNSLLADCLPPFEESWYHFHDFFNRPWFGRIWIVQEVAMAASDPNVICGPYTLSWSSVAAVSEFFSYSGLSAATTRESKTSLVAFMQYIKSKSRRLWQLLWWTGLFASTEPRDKIFALYGLVHQIEEDLLASELLRVDYQKPVKDVYRDMMFGYIMHYRSLELMSEAVEVSGEEERLQGLPSWVPDWSLPVLARQLGVGTQAGPSGFDACGGQGTLVQGSMRGVNPDLLRVAGSVVDAIAWVSEPFDGSEYALLPWHRRPFVLKRLWEDVRERLGSDRHTCHAFWRTLLANADMNGSPVTDELYTTFLRCWHDSYVQDQAAASYRARQRGDVPLTEERERELFKEYALYNITSCTDEDFRAYRACMEHLASQFLPCDSTADCRHCRMMNLPLPEGFRITGPSPALPKRDTDPFLGDFFSALGRDHRLMLCHPEVDILSRMRHTLQNRTFVITKKGMMGLAPKRARVGDAVAVLSGAKVPFILRPTGAVRIQEQIDAGPRVTREYRVVGDSYVHGIMRGEAVREVDWQKGGYEVLDLV